MRACLKPTVIYLDLGSSYLTLPARTNVRDVMSDLLSIICSSNQITRVLVSLWFVSLKPCICLRPEEDCKGWRRPVWHWAARESPCRWDFGQHLLEFTLWLKLNGFLTLKRQGQPALSTKLCVSFKMLHTWSLQSGHWACVCFTPQKMQSPLEPQRYILIPKVNTLAHERYVFVERWQFLRT